MSDLRTMVREILTEEIQALKATMSGGHQIVHETINLYNDGDLNAFVKRILEMGQDPHKRAEILSGRHCFQLGVHSSVTPQYVPSTISSAPQQTVLTIPAAPSSEATHTSSPRQEFNKGLMTERDIEWLPAGTRVVTLSKSARLTPLAKDELSRLNIKIERKAA